MLEDHLTSNQPSPVDWLPILSYLSRTRLSGSDFIYMYVCMNLAVNQPAITSPKRFFRPFNGSLCVPVRTKDPDTFHMKSQCIDHQNVSHSLSLSIACSFHFKQSQGQFSVTVGAAQSTHNNTMFRFNKISPRGMTGRNYAT